MKTLAAFVAVLAMTATAAAESFDATQPTVPNTTYVGTAVSFGGQRGLQAAVLLDGGKRLGDSPVFVRGQLTTGTDGEDGAFQQLRVGVEARTCAVREFFCAFAGGDVGYQHDRVDGMSWALFGDDLPERYVVDAHDAIVVPRAGVEAGRHIKLRAAIELPVYRRLDHGMDSDRSAGGTGFTAALGLGYAF